MDRHARAATTSLPVWPTATTRSRYARSTASRSEARPRRSSISRSTRTPTRPCSRRNLRQRPTPRSAAFAFAGEPGATFECNEDDAGWATCTGPLELTGLGDGSHTLAVRQTDALGNTSAAATVTWLIDTTAPAAPAFSAPATPAPGSATITFTAGAGVTYECSIDGGAWTACSSPLRLSGLTPGMHLALVRATDAAGNTGESSGHAFVIAAPAALVPPPPAPAPFVVQVRYRLPITCLTGCTTRAWIYQGERLVDRGTLLGRREALVIRNRAGRVRFFIPITTDALRAAPSTAATGSLTIQTRLVVTSRGRTTRSIRSVRYGT